MNNATLRVAIVGCGLIGRRRAHTLTDAKLVGCADIDFGNAQSLAGEMGCSAFDDWRKMLDSVTCEIVIVSTLHDSLAEITAAAVAAGRHVLVEKPAARFVSELEPILAMARARGVRVRVGFNHRYHRALIKARELVDAGELGKLMFLRARYGHGGRLGYDREWRANARLSGGGELIDQAPHLIDLARWFLGDFATVQGFAHTFFWDMPVDDNAFMLLRTADQKTAMLHASWTEWKNMFSFELYGKAGKIDINGLGGSYGTERITFYRMLPKMGPPETTIWEFPGADESWAVEFSTFVDDIRLNRAPSPGIEDAIAVLRVVEQIARESGYDYRS
jgi:predicted dehydrogenase